MSDMPALARIERLVVLIAFSVLVVGLIVEFDLWDGTRLRSDYNVLAHSHTFLHSARPVAPPGTSPAQ
jgi:hypothetical protein